MVGSSEVWSLTVSQLVKGTALIASTHVASTQVSISSSSSWAMDMRPLMMLYLVSVVVRAALTFPSSGSGSPGKRSSVGAPVGCLDVASAPSCSLPGTWITLKL